MKELDSRVSIPAGIVQQVLKQTLLVPMLPHRGHTLFELETRTGVINEVHDFEVSTTLGSKVIVRKATARAGCLYCSALNRANAEKHFIKKIANMLGN